MVFPLFSLRFSQGFYTATFDSRRATQRSHLKTRTGVRQFTEVGRDQLEVSTFPQVIWGVQLQLVLDGWIYIYIMCIYIYIYYRTIVKGYIINPTAPSIAPNCATSHASCVPTVPQAIGIPRDAVALVQHFHDLRQAWQAANRMIYNIPVIH